MANEHWEDRTFPVQHGSAAEWRRVVDTALPGPADIVDPGAEPVLASLAYPVRASSVVVLRRHSRGPGVAGDDSPPRSSPIRR